MNSGKSMMLLATAYSLQERGIFFIILKSALDTRDKGVIHSRSLGDRECIIVNNFDSIKEKLSNIPEALHIAETSLPRYILVDEAQFLTKHQVDDLASLADDFGFTVICYGLRTDFQTNLFDGSKRLFEIADRFEEIESICNCGKKTIVNARIDEDGNVLTDGEQIMVGAEDKYISMCRSCYQKKILKNKI
jgi:thymidine kinase